MAFLDWIANWAEEHIPLLGGWIAWLVRLMQGAIEGAYGWIGKTVSWIQNTFIPWAKETIDDISRSLSNAWTWIKQHIEPTLDALERGWNWLEEKVKNLDEWFGNFTRNLPTIIWQHIPESMKRATEMTLSVLPTVFQFIMTFQHGFSLFLTNPDWWFLGLLKKYKPVIVSWASEVIEPISKWIDDVKLNLSKFLEDPIGYIKGVVDPIIAPLEKGWNEFKGWVDEKVNGFIDAISGIDDFILLKLEEFAIGLIKWFISTLIDDLAHLQYDPETKQIYGEPKNPITHILIWFFEVEKPENPYKSVKDRMGVKDYGVEGHARY